MGTVWLTTIRPMQVHADISHSFALHISYPWGILPSFPYAGAPLRSLPKPYSSIEMGRDECALCKWSGRPNTSFFDRNQRKRVHLRIKEPEVMRGHSSRLTTSRPYMADNDGAAKVDSSKDVGT